MSETKQAIAIQFHERLLEALSKLVSTVDGTLQGYGILEAPIAKSRALLSEISKAAE